MQKPAALTIGAALLLTLSACGTSGPALETGCDVPSGNSSEAIEATGEVGTAPDDLSFPTPLVAPTTEATILQPGTGETIDLMTPILANFAVYNGRTGEVVNPYSPVSVDQATGEPLLLTLEALSALPGFQEAMQCATDGSRIAIAVPPEEAFGEAGNTPLGIGADDTLVFVADVVETFPSRATGAPQPAEGGFPSVVTDIDGVPGITLPSSGPPSEYRETTLRSGSGATVEEGDLVTVHYTGVVWDSGEVFDSSWTRAAPARFPAQEGSATQQGVVPGFADALIGSQVGDQILAVLPPEVAYGEEGTSGIPANSTLVFVIDVLGVDK